MTAPAAPGMPTVADLYAMRCLLALATVAEMARLHRRIADLEDAVESARANCEREQTDHQRTRALVPPEARPGPHPADTHHTPKGDS